MIRTHRSIHAQGIRLAAVAGLALVGASSAQAQWGTPRYPGSGAQLVFEWQGNVDRETQIHVGRSNVSVRGVGSNESRGRIVSRGTLPRGGGTLYVQRLDGRGAIDVIRQPGANGSGDGVIRIRDTQGGDDFYAIRVYWQPARGTMADGRGRDGDWDRRDDRASDRADRRADKFERKAEKFERKAEEARRKADRRDDRDDRRRRDGRW